MPPRAECGLKRSTARIDRTTMNVVICGAFVRTIFLPGIDRKWAVTGDRRKDVPGVLRYRQEQAPRAQKRLISRDRFRRNPLP